MKEKIVGVILAAGKGTRLTPLSIKYPKPLLPVCNKPIMQYQIELMKEVGIKEIIIVVGHLKKEIINYFADGAKLGVKITYVKQGETLGLAHAVGRLEEYIKTPFLLFLGDIFLIPRDFSRMIAGFEGKNMAAVLAVKTEPDTEAIKKNFAVVLDKNDLVKQVIEKPRYVVNRLKGCGVYLFDLPIFDAIRQTPRTAMRDEYEITTSIQILIGEGYGVCARKVVDWDMNVTVVCDILECNLKQLSLLRKKNLISSSARVHPKARVVNSIIGEHSQVVYPIEIRDSVIFPRIKVNTRDSISQSVVIPHMTVKCPQERKR